MVARELPSQLAADVGMDFHPWTYVTLTLRINAASGLVALHEATSRVHAAFELFDRDPPSGIARAWIREAA